MLVPVLDAAGVPRRLPQKGISGYRVSGLRFEWKERRWTGSRERRVSLRVYACNTVHLHRPRYSDGQRVHMDAHNYESDVGQRDPLSRSCKDVRVFA